MTATTIGGIATVCSVAGGGDLIEIESGGVTMRCSLSVLKTLMQSAIDASSITSGVLNIARIPPAAIERLMLVADQPARYALTNAMVQNGDTVKQTSDSLMFVVVDDTNLNNSAGYEPYTAGSASSVPWYGVTSTPTTLSGYGIADGVTCAALQAQTYTGFTTAGTSTAYTLTPSPAITSYAARMSFDVTFNAASGTSPTLAISGLASPPNLVKQLSDGSYANIASGDIPANHRSRVVLLSTTQALVVSMPPSASAAFTGGTLTSALNEAPSVSLSSASTVNIGAAAANTINITGTTTITAFDSIADGAERKLIFAGALTLTHNATSLILPTAANITTAAGDVAEFVSKGSGNWKCVSYVRASGSALVGTGLANFTETRTVAAPNSSIPNVSLKPNTSDSNNSVSVTPKGNGAFSFHVPDNTATGGNLRGAYAVDLQLSRTTASQVAGGDYSVVAGKDNTASGLASVAVGNGNNSSGTASVAMGSGCTASGNGAVAQGSSCSASAGSSVAQGSNSSATAASAISQGDSCAAGGAASIAQGKQATSTQKAQRVLSSAILAASADSFGSDMVLQVDCTAASTDYKLVADNTGSPSTINQVPVPLNTCVGFFGIVSAKRKTANGTEHVVWNVSGSANRGASGSPSIDGTPTITATTTVPTGWTLSIVADTTNNCIQFVFNMGGTAMNIHANAYIHFVSNTYA